MYKGDWMPCNSLFCSNQYCLSPTTCCAGESVCLCYAADQACLPVPEQTPKVCAGWGLVCYPAFGCCQTVRQVFENDDSVLNGLDDIKEKFCIVSGCCLGPVCASNNYCLVPFTCCYGESQCLCQASDCAFPCTEKVPMICTCLPCCAVYPEVGCCKSISDLYPSNMEAGEGAVAEAGADRAGHGGAV